ncbi:hypothetical protein KPL70_022787 [Citrus sinensis]|nr:hypothetical protein KPL70_022787 [Citrus sinensis]
MVDTKSILDQIHELQIIVAKLRELKVEISESFQVGAIIAKLPQSWNDYRKKLLHSKENITLEELQKHLVIEEEIRSRESKDKHDYTKVNVVEASKFSKNFKVKNDKKFKKSSTQKFSGNCFFCGKKGHRQSDCRFKKKKEEVNSHKANVIENKSEEICAMVSEMQIGMITETNMAKTKSYDWWLDSAIVVGKGVVEINFTSGKKVTLYNVFHVPSVRKNLISASCMCKHGLKIVLEGNTCIVSKNGLFVGKGYSCDGMYKLSINNNNINLAYIVESCDVWHARLAHLNFRSLKYMSKHGLINCNDVKGYKCEICIQAKITKKSFPKAERNTQILDLIHTDICEYNGILTRGGYAENSKAYRLLDLDSNVIVESRDVEFIENKFQHDSNIESESIIDQPCVNTPVTSTNNNKRKESTTSFELRRSQREKKEKSLAPDFISSQALLFLVEGDRKNVLNKVPLLLNIEKDPKTFSEAMSSRDASFWREAVNDEMDSIMSNQTWVLVDLPPGSQPISSKWVFRRKYNNDGSLQTFKARLVAKGFKQRNGIDYFDTYAPVARLTSIRVLFAIASLNNLYVHQMDVKTAFLNGDLDEEIYMEQPEGFVLPGNEKKMKDLGEVDTILEANTPYDSSIKLLENSGRIVAQLEYASAIGSLMYAMHCTRPDIAFAVCKMLRFTSNPSVEHWKAIGRILGYLKRTVNLGLFYNDYPEVLEGYSDASWVTNTRDNKSTSGWIFTIAGGAVSWASKKQTCITHSTMESEFIALASAGKEAEWLRNLLFDIMLWPQPMPSISLYCDSEATLSRAYNKVYNGKSRHISLRHEYMKQLIADGVINIVYVRTNKNLADPLTKDRAQGRNSANYWNTTLKSGIAYMTKQEPKAEPETRSNIESFESVDEFASNQEIRDYQLFPKTNDEKAEIVVVPYSSVVGCLIYAMVLTKPDISYAIIVGTFDYGLVYGIKKRNEVSVKGFIDVDFARDMDKRRSLTGYLFTLNGCIINWKTTLKSVVAFSTTEAEYTVAAEAIKEAIWLRGMVVELGYEQKQLLVHCDNHSAICLNKNQVYHEKTKHIDVKLHFLRLEVSKGVMKLVKFHIDDNLTDILTKPISGAKFEFYLNSARICKI